MTDFAGIPLREEECSASATWLASSASRSGGRHTLAADGRIWRTIPEAWRRSRRADRAALRRGGDSAAAPRPSSPAARRQRDDPDDPRRFMLVRREAPVANLSLDHLFVDQDAIPTLVETKRGEDTRGRREVVAQMLDYAANAATQWKAEALRQWHVQRCLTGGVDPAADLAAIEHRPAMTTRSGPAPASICSPASSAHLHLGHHPGWPAGDRRVPQRADDADGGTGHRGPSVPGRWRPDLAGSTARPDCPRARGEGPQRQPTASCHRGPNPGRGARRRTGSLAAAECYPCGLQARARRSATARSSHDRRGYPRLAYQPPGQPEPEHFAPSAAWIRIRTEIEPGFQTDRDSLA